MRECVNVCVYECVCVSVCVCVCVCVRRKIIACVKQMIFFWLDSTEGPNSLRKRKYRFGNCLSS